MMMIMMVMIMMMMMTMIHRLLPQPQNQVLTQLLLLSLLLLLLCLPHLLLECLPEVQRKRSVLQLDTWTLCKYYCNIRRSHRWLLASYVSLSPKQLCQQTISQHGQLFFIATCLWYITAYDLCV